MAISDASRPAYAGIGARATPPRMAVLLRCVAERLAARGYVLRSGAATGADAAFESGAGSSCEIYLPWRGFNGSQSQLFRLSDEAFEISASVHPGWASLSDTVKKLMARNCYQILGADLQSPVSFVACWTPDGCESEAERTRKTGGTGQAIALASRYGIPVCNFARERTLERIGKHLQLCRQQVNGYAVTPPPLENERFPEKRPSSHP